MVVELGWSANSLTFFSFPLSVLDRSLESGIALSDVSPSSPIVFPEIFLVLFISSFVVFFHVDPGRDVVGQEVEAVSVNRSIEAPKRPGFPPLTIVCHSNFACLLESGKDFSGACGLRSPGGNAAFRSMGVRNLAFRVTCTSCSYETQKSGANVRVRGCEEPFTLGR